MLKINYLKFLLVVTLLASFLVSCGDDEEPAPTLPQSEVKTGELTQSETWSADRIYFIQGKLVVPNGVILTIEPGTIIKGKQGQLTNASTLVVARGGKLMAEGTAAKPIIFTTEFDNIELGQKAGTNLDETDNQKWGGIVILGKAKISAKIGDTEAQIEGLDADSEYAKYGGNDDADNSGSLKYVAIRHGGIAISEGNEINGLTLGGVGSGTTIDYIEVLANLDDGIECFGGSVVIKHALVAYQGDDAFDIDQNFSGSFKNSMVVYDSSFGDEFLEIDGPENSTHTTGMFTIENCKFIDKSDDGSCDLKSKAQGVCKNNEFVGLEKFKLSLKLDTDCTTVLTDAYTRYVDGDLEIKTNKVAANTVLNVYTKSEDAGGTDCDVPATQNNAAQTIYSAAANSDSATPTIVSQSDFAWTWTAINNKF